MEFTGLRFLPTQELLTYEIGYEHLHRYYSIAPVLKNKKVLDIACGEGYGSAIISSYAASSIGVDLDQEVINEAKTKYAEINNLSFICGSAASIPCEDDSFDVVVSFETIEHLSEEMQEQFMNEIKRVMVPGGVLIMSTPNKDNYTIRYNNINPFHKHEFNENEYTQFINKHFKHYVLYNQGFEVVGIIDNQSTRNEPIINQINYSQINDYNEVKRKYFIYGNL